MLQVQSPKDAIFRARQIILEEGLADTKARIAWGLEGFQKKTAVIADELWLDEKNVRNFGRDHVHGSVLQAIRTLGRSGIVIILVSPATAAMTVEARSWEAMTRIQFDKLARKMANSSYGVCSLVMHGSL